jgi:hypothetical protein
MYIGLHVPVMANEKGVHQRRLQIPESELRSVMEVNLKGTNDEVDAQYGPTSSAQAVAGF